MHVFSGSYVDKRQAFTIGHRIFWLSTFIIRVRRMGLFFKSQRVQMELRIIDCAVEVQGGEAQLHLQSDHQLCG